MNVSQALVTAAQHSADLQGDTSQTKGWEENAALAAEIGNADSVRARGRSCWGAVSVLLTRVRVVPLGRGPCFISSSSWMPCSCKTDLSSSGLAMCHGVVINLNYVSSPPSLSTPALPRERST